MRSIQCVLGLFLEGKGQGRGIDYPPILVPKLKQVERYTALAQRPIDRPIQWVPGLFLHC